MSCGSARRPGRRSGCWRGRRGGRSGPGLSRVPPAAVTQVSHRHSDGRTYYERKLAEGKTPKEALRALNRQVSDAIFARLQADAHRAAAHSR